MLFDLFIKISEEQQHKTKMKLQNGKLKDLTKEEKDKIKKDKKEEQKEKAKQTRMENKDKPKNLKKDKKEANLEFKYIDEVPKENLQGNCIL
jgi:hypothetical protein